MRNLGGGRSQRGNVQSAVIEYATHRASRGVKDIQLPAISRSRLARPCRLMPLLVLTVTARDCGRSCDRDTDGFFTAVNRGRITRENSNCRKTLLIVDWDVRAALRSWMPTSGVGVHTQYRRVPFTSYNTTALCDNGAWSRVLSTS